MKNRGMNGPKGLAKVGIGEGVFDKICFKKQGQRCAGPNQNFHKLLFTNEKDLVAATRRVFNYPSLKW